jgi:Ca2+-binding RTX toxin-like protein
MGKFFSWLGNRKKKNQPIVNRPSQKKLRPRVEALEDRTVPVGGQFANSAAIIIPDSGNATPYPSAINVAGLQGVVTFMAIDFLGLSHSSPDDIDALVASPVAGNNAIVMSDAGGFAPGVVGVNITFNDSAAGQIPDSTNFASGLYQLSNFNSGTDTFPAPAPAPSAFTSLAAAFNGINPNGTWNLFIVDDVAGDSGSLSAGWRLNFRTSIPVIDANDVGGNGQNNGIADDFRIVRNGANLEVYLNGNLSRIQPFAEVTQIIINGSNDADTLTIDQSGGFINVPVNFTGGGGFDTLKFKGGTVTTVTYNHTNATDGNVNVDGTVYTYTGLSPIIDNMNAANRIMNFNNNAQTITLQDDAGAVAGVSEVTSPGQAETVTFNNPTASLTINGGTGGNVIRVFPTIDPNYTTPVTNINSGNGDDQIRVLRVATGTVVNTNTQNGLGDTTVVGADAFPAGNQGTGAGTLNNILGTVNVDDSGGVGELFVDASADAAGTYNFSATQIDRGVAKITYTANMNPVHLATGVGNDTVNVTGTTAAVNTVFTNAGNDTVTVTATKVGTELDIDTAGGVPDHVVIGVGTFAAFNTGTGSLANVQGTINVQDSGGVGETYIDDSVDAVNGRIFNFTDTASIPFFNVAGFTVKSPGFLGGAINISDASADGAFQFADGKGGSTHNIDAAIGNVFSDMTFFGNDGGDTYNVSLAAGQNFIQASFIINANGNLATERDRVNIKADDAAVRNVTITYGTTDGEADITGLGTKVEINTTETLTYSDANDNDTMSIVGTATDDEITVHALDANSAVIFRGGNPNEYAPGESLLGQFPGVSGDTATIVSGPDILVDGIQQTGLEFDGGGGAADFDRLYWYGGSNTTGANNNGALVDTTLGFQPFGGFAQFAGQANGTLIPFYAGAAALDVIQIFDFGVFGTRGGTQLIDVNINTASFINPAPAVNPASLVVNTGEETAASMEPDPVCGLRADSVSVFISAQLSIAANGGDPVLNSTPGLPMAGDQLAILNTFFSVDVWATKPAPGDLPIVTFQFNFGGGPLPTTFTESGFECRGPIFTNIVNLIGDNNDDTVDQNDEFVVRGQDVDFTNGGDLDGTNEFVLIFNHSNPIPFSGVQFLNVFGDDRRTLTGTEQGDGFANDVDHLDIKAYADNTPRGWGIQVFFNEDEPAWNQGVFDGQFVDLITYRTSFNPVVPNPGVVSENIVLQPSGPDNGEIRNTNAADGSLIYVLSYVNNTDLIFIDDDLGLSDTDTLFLNGTNGVTPQVSGNEIIDADFTRAGTVAAPFITVSDRDRQTAGVNNILYRVLSIFGGTTDPITNVTTPTSVGFQNIIFQGLGGNDVFNLNPGAGAFNPATLAGRRLITADGGAGNDFFNATVAATELLGVTLRGGAGDDVLFGSRGIDFLEGNDGNDLIVGFVGDDFAQGGAGSDTFVWNPGDGDDNFEGDSGVDQLQFNGANGNDTYTLSAVNGRLIFQRQPGNVSVESGGVEVVNIDSFTVDLNGRNEFPTNNSVTQGFANFAFNPVTRTFDVRIFVPNIAPATITDSHIHLNVVGSNGPVVLPLGGGAGYTAVNGGAELVLTGLTVNNFNGGSGLPRFDELMAALQGHAYFNVHTAANPGGEVRGQVTVGSTTSGSGGADTFVINDLTGTGVTTINAHLGQDREAEVGAFVRDSVVINGRAVADTIVADKLNAIDDDYRVTGMGYELFVFGSDGASATVANRDLLTINGLAGDDSLRTVLGMEAITQIVLDGGDGNDLLDADATLIGGAGDDTLLGGAGNDSLDGGAGNDLLDGAAGDDTMIGGDGDDTFLHNTGNNTVTGGNGFDRFLLTGNEAANTFDLKQVGTVLTITQDGVTGNNDFTTMERVDINANGGDDTVTFDGLTLAALVDLGSGNDTFKAAKVTADTTGVILLTAGIGNDLVIGGAGADSLYGGSGNDTIVGGAGVDFEYGEDGNDLIGDTTTAGNGVADDAGADFMFGGDGIDQFVWEPGDGSDVIQGGVDATDILRFFGSAAAEAFIVQSAGAAPTHTNIILGAATVDTHGVEQLLLSTGAGADTVTINDIYPTEYNAVNVDLGTADGAVDLVIVNGRTTADNLTVSTAAATTARLQGLRYDVNLTSTEVADKLTVNGNEGDDTIRAEAGTETAITILFTGGAGNDSLFGAGGADNLDGGAGNDLINGGAGVDTLTGGDGEDTFVTGAGNDSVDGGAGFDTLLVNGTSGNDNIDANQTANGSFTATVSGTADTDTLVVGTVEAVRIDTGAGIDLIRVTQNNGLTAANSLRFDVAGGTQALDRLIVTDDGTGNLVLHRRDQVTFDGSIQVGLFNPVLYTNVRFIDFQNYNSVTGTTGTDGAGRIVTFSRDIFEYNNDRFNSTEESFLEALTARPNIDPGNDTVFGAPGDEDWYVYRTPRVQTIVFNVLFTPVPGAAGIGLPGGGLLDVDVFDANGVAIPGATSTAIPGGRQVRIAVSPDNAQFRQVFFRVRGATPDAINNYTVGLSAVGQNGAIETDNLGPQVTNITINGQNFDLFAPKPGQNRPTPLITQIRVDFQDRVSLAQPARAPGFLYPALQANTVTPGMFQVKGDHVGIIPVASVNVTNNPVVAGQIATAFVILNFDQPLPDDRYTITVFDGITDPPGNALDGDNNDVPGGNFTTSGNDVSGGNFVGVFVVDSRPELGFYQNGLANLDINDDHSVNPQTGIAGFRDFVVPYTPAGSAVFTGQFTPAFTANDVNVGWDMLGTYGSFGGKFLWTLDFNSDGVPDYRAYSAIQVNGLPVAGNFNVNKDGDEIGLFTGSRWYFDTNGNNNIDPGDYTVAGNMRGTPFVGDFDGDGLYDLGTYRQGFIQIDLFARGSITGNADFTIAVHPSIGTRLTRPVAADMDQDGVTDIGFWVPGVSGTPGSAQWFFFVSNDPDGTQRQAGTMNLFTNNNVVMRGFRNTPFSADFATIYGPDSALPLVGNFDPPANLQTNGRLKNPPKAAAIRPASASVVDMAFAEGAWNRRRPLFN